MYVLLALKLLCILEMCRQCIPYLTFIPAYTCRLGYFIGLGVGAGANILTRYAVSPKYGLLAGRQEVTITHYSIVVQCKMSP